MSQNSGDQNSFVAFQSKSPNTSDIQDPYAYFSMHQTYQPPHIYASHRQQANNTAFQINPGVQFHINPKQSVGPSQKTNSLKVNQTLLNANFTDNCNNNQSLIDHSVAKSCRPNLYKKSDSPWMASNQLDFREQQKMLKEMLIHHKKQEEEVLKSQSFERENMKSRLTNHIDDKAPQMKIFDMFELNNPSQKPDVTVSERLENTQKVSIQSPSPFNQGGLRMIQVAIDIQSSSDQNVQRKIMSGTVGKRFIQNQEGAILENGYNQDKAERKSVGQKQLVSGLPIGSACSGSRGSNYNSSVSTAPVQKLSDVQNPQKFMTFRYMNRKATQIPEIVQFKNLQELDLSGNLLQNYVKELETLSFLKRLNLSNNKITEAWVLPQSLEILNLSYNQIKEMPEEVAIRLKNLTTIDISCNKLESLTNFNHFNRVKRLIAKQNFVRQLSPIYNCLNIYELDLESNAIDSHKDFLMFIKSKNDLILVNLFMNPLMVDISSIDILSEQLIHHAPDIITLKSQEEILELKDLLRNPQIKIGEEGPKEESKGEGQVQKIEGGECGKLEEDTGRFNFHLIEELRNCLTFLKNGVLYRNRRVYNKIKQLQNKSKRSVSHFSNSSHSQPNNASAGGGRGLLGTPSGVPKSGSMIPSPILSKKSHRYENVEAIYDYIVEQEELRRLKEQKMLAKRRKEKRLKLLSRLDMAQQPSESSSEGDSIDIEDEFSDDDFDEDQDDFMDDGSSHNLNPSDLPPHFREEFKLLDDQREIMMLEGSNCIVNEKAESGQMLVFSHLQNHIDEELLSQTITSDLDVDMNQYQRIYESLDLEKLGSGPLNREDHLNTEDNEFLNGSTAGFGKKLREINREINQEQLQLEQEELNGQIDSEVVGLNNLIQGSSSVQQKKDVKIRERKEGQKKIFDLKLQKAKIIQLSEMELNLDIQANIRRPLKTEQNSNMQSIRESHQTHPLPQGYSLTCTKEGLIPLDRSDVSNREQVLEGAGQKLDQSFSLKNIQTAQEGTLNKTVNHEVESLMMNRNLGIVQEKQVSKMKEECMSVKTEPGRQVNNKTMLGKYREGSGGEQESHQMVSESEILLQLDSQNINLNESLVQSSMVSVSQQSKRNIIPNLDLSKCKKDIEDFQNFFVVDPLLLKKKKLYPSLVSHQSKEISSKGINVDEEISIEFDGVDRYQVNMTVLCPINNKLTQTELGNQTSNSKKNTVNVQISPKIKLKQRSNDNEQQNLKEWKPDELNKSKNSSPNQHQSALDNQSIIEKTKLKLVKINTDRIQKVHKFSKGDGTNLGEVVEDNRSSECSRCEVLKDQLIKLRQEHEEQIKILRDELRLQHQTLLKIKNSLCIQGKLEDKLKLGETDIPSQASSNNLLASQSTRKVIKLQNLPSIVTKFFFRLYQDLEKIQGANQALLKQQRQHDQEIEQIKHDHLTQLETIRLKHAISCNELKSTRLFFDKNHIFMSGQKPNDEQRILLFPQSSVRQPKGGTLPCKLKNLHLSSQQLEDPQQTINQSKVSQHEIKHFNEASNTKRSQNLVLASRFQQMPNSSLDSQQSQNRKLTCQTRGKSQKKSKHHLSKSTKRKTVKQLSSESVGWNVGQNLSNNYGVEVDLRQLSGQPADRHQESQFQTQNQFPQQMSYPVSQQGFFQNQGDAIYIQNNNVSPNRVVSALTNLNHDEDTSLLLGTSHLFNQNQNETVILKDPYRKNSCQVSKTNVTKQPYESIKSQRNSCNHQLAKINILSANASQPQTQSNTMNGLAGHYQTEKTKSKSKNPTSRPKIPKMKKLSSDVSKDINKSCHNLATDEMRGKQLSVQRSKTSKTYQELALISSSREQIESDFLQVPNPAIQASREQLIPQNLPFDDIILMQQQGKQPNTMRSHMSSQQRQLLMQLFSNHLQQSGFSNSNQRKTQKVVSSEKMTCNQRQQSKQNSQHQKSKQQLRKSIAQRQSMILQEDTPNYSHIFSCGETTPNPMMTEASRKPIPIINSDMSLRLLSAQEMLTSNQLQDYLQEDSFGGIFDTHMSNIQRSNSNDVVPTNAFKKNCSIYPSHNNQILDFDDLTQNIEHQKLSIDHHNQSKDKLIKSGLSLKRKNYSNNHGQRLQSVRKRSSSKQPMSKTHRNTQLASLTGAAVKNNSYNQIQPVVCLHNDSITFSQLQQQILKNQVNTSRGPAQINSQMITLAHPDGSRHFGHSDTKGGTVVKSQNQLKIKLQTFTGDQLMQPLQLNLQNQFDNRNQHQWQQQQSSGSRPKSSGKRNSQQVNSLPHPKTE